MKKKLDPHTTTNLLLAKILIQLAGLQHPLNLGDRAFLLQDVGLTADQVADVLMTTPETVRMSKARAQRSKNRHFTREE